MFRITTFSIDDLRQSGTAVDHDLAAQLQFHGFDHNDALEGHMAAYVRIQVTDESWAELQPQIKAHDNGNSHFRMLDTYMRMLAEYRRIKDNRRRGLDRSYLLGLDELQQIADAATHPSSR
jgi:uncharacterized protein YfbU (UPF0304 family)